MNTAGAFSQSALSSTELPFLYIKLRGCLFVQVILSTVRPHSNMAPIPIVVRYKEKIRVGVSVLAWHFKGKLYLDFCLLESGSA